MQHSLEPYKPTIFAASRYIVYNLTCIVIRHIFLKVIVLELGPQ